MAQNPKPSEVKRTGSWLSGHRGNENSDEIATLKKSIGEKDQTIIQRDQTIAQKDVQISEKDKLLLEKDVIIAKLSKENESLLELVKNLESKIRQLEAAPTTQNAHSSKTDKSNALEIPEPSGRLRESNAATEYDICILYYAETGSPCAHNLLPELSKASLKVTSIETPFDLNDQSAKNNTENIVASSRSLVVVLSKNVLTILSALYVMKCALAYSLRIVLVHDNESCLFPGVTEQPLFLIKADVFYDKAITYFKDYVSTCVESIVKKLTKQKATVENVDTRAFLSHKRSTAQGIAGRIFQGLKADYKIFLDSDAEFDLHDLKELVKHTKLFIFILSEGIFESKWCLQELRAALDFGKKIFMLRDFQYNLPEVLPPQVADLAYLFQNTPPLVYMAELYDACIQRIKDELGPPDAVIHAIERDDKLMKRINEKDFQKIPVLKLTQDFVLGYSMEGWLQGLNKYFDVPFDLLEEVDFTNCDDFITLHGVKYLISNCKNLKKVNFSFTNINSETLKALSGSCTQLEDINLEGCQIDSDSVASLSNCLQLKRINLNETRTEEKAVVAAIAPLQHLERLEISTGSIRDEISKKLAEKSATLTYLDVGTLFGSAISLLSLAPCTNLKHLVAWQSHFNDEILEKLFPSLPNLETVDLGRNNFTADGVKHIAANCHQLRAIMFETATLTKETLEVLVEGCPLLTRIDFRSTKLSAEMGIVISKLHHLEYLDVGNSEITDEGLIPIIQNNPKLTVFNSYGNQLTDSVAKQLAQSCPLLCEVDLECSKVTDEGCKAILENCLHLEKFFVSRTYITDQSFKHFATCSFPSKLKSVSLAATGLTGEGIKCLVERSPDLTHVSLMYNPILDENSFEHLGKLKELTYLAVSESGIGNRGLQAIAEGCPKLQELYLSHCSNWYDQAMDSLGKKCKLLKKITLNSTLGNLTENACKNLAQIHNIQYLSISGCHFLKDSALGHILKANPNIRVLYISSSKQLSDITLKNIADYCPKIKELYMENLPEVTDKGMRALADGAKYLRTIKFMMCPKLTWQGKKLFDGVEKG